MPAPNGFEGSCQYASRLMADLARMKAKAFVPPPISASQSDLDVAIIKAVHFLEKEFCIVGCWSDFFHVAGGGRDWITAYVGWSLLQTKIVNPDVIRQAGVLLERDRYASGAWGYRPGLPTDADSSSWAVLFLKDSEYPIDLSEAVKVLLTYQNPVDGGFSAYRTPDEIGRYIGVDPSEDLSGWCSAHLCVTCAAVQALYAVELSADSAPIRSALAFIRERQSDAGYWNSYWYYGKTYGTAHTVRVLRDVGDASDKSRIASARAWLENTQLDDGGWNSGIIHQAGRAFDTALAIRTLLDVESSPISCSQRGIDWLLQRQRSNGSWDSKPTLQLPKGSDHTPWNRTNWPNEGGPNSVCVPDENRFYTTATVLQALTAWDRHLSSKKRKQV